MKQLYTLAMLMCLSFCASAQNWQTMRSNDTVYFLADASPSIGDNDTNYLRAIYTDSAITAGTDSVFYFYKGARSIQPGSCIDTLGMSWMGPEMIHRTDGADLYFNSRNDTVRIWTKAAAGDTWIMARDSAGNLFKATMQQPGIMTIDNVLDSVKTFVIQAFAGSNPVSSIYNGYALMLSKQHGWIQTLDWYSFPNVLPFSNYTIGLRNKNGIHHRQEKSFAGIDLQHEDVLWKYAPGNEWISFDELQSFTSTNNHRIYIHDSVISSQVNGSQLVVQMESEHFRQQLMYVQTPSGVTTYLQDTAYTTYGTYNFPLVSPAATYTVRQLKKEAKDYTFPVTTGHADSLRYYNTVNEFCGRKTFNFRPAGERLWKDTCYRIGYSVSGGLIRNYTLLQGFGQTNLNEMQGNGTSLDYIKSFYYPYMKVGNCISGTRFDVLTLGMAAAQGKEQLLIDVYPNPVSGRLYVNNKYAPIAAVMLYDVQGRKQLVQQVTGHAAILDTGAFPAGCYILRVICDDGVYTKQVVIQ